MAADLVASNQDAAADTALLILRDDDMDGINAAGQMVTTRALASASKGSVVSFSITNLVASKIVTVSTANSLAIAIGVHPQTLTSAGAAGF